MVQRANHTAASRLIAQGNRIALTQEFREGGFCRKSAVVPYPYWRRYEYALDREWLRTGAYSILKASAEF